MLQSVTCCQCHACVSYCLVLLVLTGILLVDQVSLAIGGGFPHRDRGYIFVSMDGNSQRMQFDCLSNLVLAGDIGHTVGLDEAISVRYKERCFPHFVSGRVWLQKS